MVGWGQANEIRIAEPEKIKPCLSTVACEISLSSSD
jgi:hypothetical protein